MRRPAPRYERTHGGAPCPIDFGELPVIAPPSFGHWLTWRSPGFQRLLDDLRAPLAEGKVASDPRTSAPDAVARTMKRFNLGEAAAALYLERIALPRPRKDNGAARELEKKSLRPAFDRGLYGLSASDEPVFGVCLPLRPLGEIFRDAALER